MVQAWYDHAMLEYNAAASATKGGSDHGSAQRQLIFMELAIACILQLQETVFRAQAPIVIEAMKPLFWATVSVEAALQLVLRLLHGCYSEPHPYWTAGPNALALSTCAWSTRRRKLAQTAPT